MSLPSIFSNSGNGGGIPALTYYAFWGAGDPALGDGITSSNVMTLVGNAEYVGNDTNWSRPYVLLCSEGNNRKGALNFNVPSPELVKRSEWRFKTNLYYAGGNYGSLVMYFFASANINVDSLDASAANQKNQYEVLIDAETSSLVVRYNASVIESVTLPTVITGDSYGGMEIVFKSGVFSIYYSPETAYNGDNGEPTLLCKITDTSYASRNLAGNKFGVYAFSGLIDASESRMAGFEFTTLDIMTSGASSPSLNSIDAGIF